MSNILGRAKLMSAATMPLYSLVWLIGALAGCTSEVEPPGSSRTQQALQRASETAGNEEGAEPLDTTEIFGNLQSGGPTPREAARRYLLSRAAEWKLARTDLSSQLPPDRAGAVQVPVLWDAAKQRYRFTRVSFGQRRGGIPVFGARIDVLVRNEEHHPVVLVTSEALPLGDFQPAGGQAGIDPQKIRDFASQQVTRDDFLGATQSYPLSELDTFGDATPVIWAGTHAAPATPRLAATLIAHSSSGEGRVRFVLDATTGDVLHAEDLVLFETVSGQIQGRATPGPSAAECEPIVESAMAHAHLLAGDQLIVADQNGAFTLDVAPNEPITLTSSMSGPFFKVRGPRGGQESLSATITAPTTVDLVHNEQETEGVLAQVNGYLHANQVRDWLLTFHPDFPAIAAQQDFPVNVNLSSNFCPGNAWYDGASINFCRSSRQFSNTSFANVNHHEFGHHVVASAGSGQGAYGEGMGDVIALLLADSPELGVGFFRNACDEPLRNADNDCQYSPRRCSSCGRDIHSCGQLISGIIWDIREQLAATEAENALPILSNLVVNSILLHKGQRIDGRIAVHLLTLDDDDAEIANGTPHRMEICSGFEAHGIACPPLVLQSLGPSRDSL